MKYMYDSCEWFLEKLIGRSCNSSWSQRAIVTAESFIVAISFCEVIGISWAEKKNQTSFHNYHKYIVMLIIWIEFNYFSETILRDHSVYGTHETK